MRFFEPELATPNKKAAGGRGDQAPLPYTLMYASGLRNGLTTQDLVTMPVNRLANMLIALAPPDDGGGRDDVRDATQADIDRLR